MAANQYGIDMADIYRTTAAVKGMRNQNKMNQMKIDESQRVIAKRPAQLAFKNKLTGLRQKAVGGDQNATQQLLSLDPENGPKFIDALGTMDKTKRDATKRTVDEIGKLSSYVLQGKTQEEKSKRYSLLLNNISPEAASKLPPTFDENFVHLSLAKAMAMDKLIEAPTVRTVGNKNILYRAGQQVDSATIPVKPGNGGYNGIKTSDEKAMASMTASLFGGMYDPATGQFSLTDKTLLPKVQAVIEAATVYYRDGRVQGMTAAQSVSKAARDFGVALPSPENQNNDPLGIR